MALIVPSGVELGNADSYVSLIYADAYHEAFGRTDWAGADDDRKEWLLKRASMMIDARYTWDDTIVFTNVPRPVQLATAELAYYYLGSAIVSDAGVKSVQVGAIQVEFESASASIAANAKTGIWGFIDMVLAGIASSPLTATGNTAGVITVERA